MEGAEEKFLKLAKYAAAHIAAWLTMEQVGGCPMAMAWQCGRARWYGMAWYGIVWYGMAWHGGIWQYDGGHARIPGRDWRLLPLHYWAPQKLLNLFFGAATSLEHAPVSHCL